MGTKDDDKKAQRRAWGNATDLMLLALKELGKATRSQMQEIAGIDKYSAGQAVSRMTRVTKRGENVGSRRAHVCGWVSEHDGQRDYLRPVYAIGDGKDAPRPPPKCMKQVKREYWQRRKMRLEMMAPGSDLQKAWNSKG